jgi:hypothetical protein
MIVYCSYIVIDTKLLLPPGPSPARLLAQFTRNKRMRNLLLFDYLFSYSCNANIYRLSNLDNLN